MTGRIAVSGYGAITSLGDSAATSFDGLLMGRPAFREATTLDLSDPYFFQKKVAQVAAHPRVRAFNLPDEASSTALTLCAMEEALSHAGLGDLRHERVGIAVTTIESGALEEVAKVTDFGEDGDLGRLLNIADPEFCVREIRKRVGAVGPGVVLSNACASGNHAIAAGFDMINCGEADIVIVGGGCKIFLSAVVGFHQFTGISADTCRPFDKGRSGTMLGDGAGILVLESEEHLRSRGRKEELWLLGYGTSCDSYDMMAPHPEAVGMELAMRRALRMARIQPQQVDYINAHGTGTIQNDRLETMAMRHLFGKHADKLLISSTKSMLGHSLYAASALEAVWCCRVLDTGMVPPTANLRECDEECNLNYVANQARRFAARVCMNNSFGFGGSNASTIFAKTFS